MTEANVSNSAVERPSPSSRSLLPRWLVAIAFGIPIALVILAASAIGSDFFYVLIGIPALLAVWGIAGLCSLVLSLRAAMRKDWRRCAAAAILPVVLLAVALDPIQFVRSTNYLGDVAHFAVMKSSYDRSVAALPADQRPHRGVRLGRHVVCVPWRRL